MDEDAGVKAPVTRLRRRLSVEQTEESKSPAVTNTPTKKRGGKKAAAKPELELIDENTPDNSTTQRTTKKTAAKDVTSQEEKPVTPARRSRRALSNTSLVSETALDVNSPRARRALRRASQAGSDSDAPLTPIRQSRRTRKDSASSVEKEPQLPPKQGIQITEVIIEEPEVNSIKLTPQSETTTADRSNSPNITRKSPRLLEKNKLTPTQITDEESCNDTSVTTKSTKTPGIIPISSSDPTLSPSSHATENAKSRTDTSQSQNKTEISQNRLSIGSAKLIKNLNTEVIKKSNFNKSWSDTESNQKTTKIPRTKSWTILSVSDDSQSYSNNLSFKSKIKDNVKSPLVLKSKSGSGDGSFNTSLNQDVSNKSMSKRKKKDSMNFVVEDINEPSEKINTIENNTEKQLKNETLSVDNNTTINDNTMQASNLFEKGPSGDVKTIVFIEDYDSNSEKINVQARHESEDQCVPVVEHSVEKFPIGVNSFTSILDKNEQNIFNKSKELSQRKDGEAMDCEPMDIDETIPEDIKISEIISPEQITTGRSSTNVDVSNLSSEEIVNKSGRKSSINQSLDENGIETKSTLILSQIKDSSTGDINNVVKSPQIIKNKVLSKSVHDLNITQENDTKKNSSLHYSTSTPLQDKNIQKFKGIHVNTPIVASQNTVNKNSTIEVPHISKDRSKNISETEDSESSDDDSKKPFYTENEVKGKKSPTKHTSIIQNEIPHAKVKESKEKMETNEVILDENLINVNNKDVVTLKQKNESKLADVSINDKSIKPQSKIKKSKKNKSSSEESEEEIVSGDDSKEKSDFIDDEAFDAGDDYESGDSQDESERRYEEENEVIDKGETLTTDDEFSDSDYEKDSFIVSSNEEDEDLLDGTDDDLSMSDKELKMTAKSKKKFNERKVKEQKEASREMFESRHKLNSSNKRSESVIGKTKKNKRQQISSSESEEDIKPKKNNRLRLDSTKEASLVANESEYKISMKKNKQLPDSDSSSDESVANEREMTVCNESINEEDPLSAQIKTEPKTPQRSANSTIAFIDSEEVDNDQIDKNESTKTQSEFLDPLQATMVAYEEDDSLSSDNENIIQNYDSILKDLNKTNKVKDKVCDISLNTDNKSKKKETTSISEELNLTQVKSKKPKSKEESSTSTKEILPKRDEDDSSLDAVDLRLLVPEDTDNSDTSSLQNKMEAADSNSEDIISLKRTEAKTDIRKSKDNNMEKSMEISFNKSINKKNKKRKSQHKNNISDNEEEGASFFIDTVGTHGDSLNESNNHSLKKDKNQSTDNIVNKSVNKSIGEIAAEENSDEEAPLEISYQNENSSRRKSKTKDNIDILMDQTEPTTNQSLNVSKVKTLGSEKKKADIKSLADNSEDPIEPETSQKKKRKKSASNSFTPDETSSVIPDNQDVAIESETSQKKKCKKSASNSFAPDETPSVIPDNQEDPIESKTSEKVKRKKSASNSLAPHEAPSIPDNSEVPIESETSQKKKRKKSASTSFAPDEIPSIIPDNPEVPIESETSQKKERKKSASNSFASDETSSVLPDKPKGPIESETSQKKERKKSASNTFAPDKTPSVLPDNPEVPMESETSQKKKRKKSASNSFAPDETPSIIPDNPEVPIVSETSQKKKRKKSASNSVDNVTLPDVDAVEALNQSTVSNKKKKRKITAEDGIITVAETVPILEKHVEEFSNKKQDKKMVVSNVENHSDGIDKTNKNRKRKERDEETSTTKTLKENIFAKVPRLPPTVLEKLDEVSHKEIPSKKPKLESTTSFAVEEIKKKKNKPSKYLEESVYITEDSENRRNQKKRLEKPKVLPFMPTASTSTTGFTTNFKVDVLPSQITFVAQTNTVTSFRDEHLYGKRIRRLRTYDKYKTQRNLKLTKF